MALGKSRGVKKKKGYSNKTDKEGRFLGCELNHERHPKGGVAWCELCIKEGRANTHGVRA